MPTAPWILRVLWLLLLAGCASPAVSRPPSPPSTCAATAMQHVPPGLDDELRRCVGPALVEIECGRFDPAIAGDMHRIGQQCARRGATAGEVVDCCQAALGRR